MLLRREFNDKIVPGFARDIGRQTSDFEEASEVSRTNWLRKCSKLASLTSRTVDL